MTTPRKITGNVSLSEVLVHGHCACGEAEHHGRESVWEESVWGVSVDTIREVSTLGEEFSPMAALGVLGP